MRPIPGPGVFEQVRGLAASSTSQPAACSARIGSRAARCSRAARACAPEDREGWAGRVVLAGADLADLVTTKSRAV